MSESAPASAIPSRLSFPRARRILRRSEFLRVYGEGRKAHGRYVTIFCLARVGVEAASADGATGGALPWRLGITATRRVGNAVRRNRHRRLVRECFRLNGRRIGEGWDIVVNTKPELGRGTLAELTRDVRTVLGRLRLWAPDPGES